MKPKPTEKFTEFWTNRDIDIVKLDGEIRTALGVKKWEDSPIKEGFSGISVQSDFSGKRAMRHFIVVHWTLDGVFGFNIDLSPNLFGKITSVIARHKADNPLRPRKQGIVELVN